MNVSRYFLITMLAVALLVTPALATKLGDPAPALKIKDWVKGKPVDLKVGQGKQVYVIEFWATWCGPCLTSIPHLTELQKKYGDQVTFIGVSSEKNVKDVQKFVTKMGDRMDYVVAYDNQEQTYKAYMQPFNRNGIPHAFIVDQQGRLVWEGHPMFGMEEVLEAVLKGNQDIAALTKISKAAEEAYMKRFVERRELLEKYFALVSKSRNAEGAEELGRQVFTVIKDEPAMLNEFAWMILTKEDVLTRDLDLAMQAATAAVKASDSQDPSILDTYARALWDTGKKKEAIQAQKEAISITDNERMKEQLVQVLKKYEKEMADEK
ncbi:MAG: redoxin family protein [Planctomycetota bacterium]